MISIFRIYDYLLEKSIKKGKFPDHIGVVLKESEFDESKVDKFLKWCSDFEIEKVSIYVSLKDKESENKNGRIKGELVNTDNINIHKEIIKKDSKESKKKNTEIEIDTNTKSKYKIEKRGQDKKRKNIKEIQSGKKIDKRKNGVKYDISVGLGGRKEFVNVLRDLGKKVKKGNLDIEDIDRGKIEEELVFEGEPDLFIKTGGQHLSDFMLWQSVYSELYFADFNWENLRKRDFLRALREFQERERRFGK